MSMKARTAIVIACALALLLLLLFLPAGRNREPEQQGGDAGRPNPTQAAGEQVVHTSPQNGGQSVLSNSSTSRPSFFPGPSKSEQIHQALLAYNNEQIVFYGKLVDQFGEPVPDATVDFAVRVIDQYKNTTERGRTMSDVTGRFTISGYKGQDLSVNPSKPGYVPSAVRGVFNYSHLFPDEERVHPDPRVPDVIEMWKLQGAEHLISFDFDVSIPIGGTALRFDCQTGQQVKSGGDLAITVKTSAQPNTSEQYDWQVGVRAIDGGVMEQGGVGLDRMFEAPHSGYAPELIRAFQKGTPDWSSSFTGGFYFTSRNARCYGKFITEIVTFRVRNGTVPTRLRGYLNPSGSRNLEVDPNKVVAPARP